MSDEQFTIEEIQHLIPLKEQEVVHLVTRQHIVFFFVKTLLGVIAISLILLLGTVLASLSSSQLIVSLYWSLGYMLVGVIILIFAMQFHNYYLSKQILTNFRIVDYDQRGLFRAEVNETFLVNVENINIVQTNIWNTLFNFGSVDVQTAGQKTELSTSGVVFENVPEPKHVAELLSNLSQGAKERDGNRHNN
jgi:energy-coupling factor transporter transmembrane protein EcfT